MRAENVTTFTKSDCLISSDLLSLAKIYAKCFLYFPSSYGYANCYFKKQNSLNDRKGEAEIIDNKRCEGDNDYDEEDSEEDEFYGVHGKSAIDIV